ncbi:apolipoprotein N-acyltransferase [Simkania negevensis]|uniref:Apolipoprotein N-acyltransferase n=1 Tax=Simkania negevensis (strain ATCC VR-1471 / DSM 27360 / Z) TaxID=331113 RepID=F8L3Y9_SIMNZ|nr:apolipoprotein N-acyltransferase [Simkania negevensis]CCB90019.1 Apolipoprotein N-acyltransferase [Simkania negevensis Z]
MLKKNFFFLLSFIIVAWGQPDVSPILSLLASSCGFAFFWLILLTFPSKKHRFILSTLWFTAVQAVQLSWLATPQFQGTYIFFVYGGLILLLGMQFGLFSLFFPKTTPLKAKQLLALAAIWTLIEWGRLFILCGFAWNPIGLSMTAFPVSSQLASVWGIFGLSFWTALVNLLVLQAMISWNVKRGAIAAGCFLFPFLFGFLHMLYHDSKEWNEKTHVALIQTSLLPNEKSFFYHQGHVYVPPYQQWEAILSYLEEKGALEVDLIAMPEYTVPFSANRKVYDYEDVRYVLESAWGPHDWSYLLNSRLAEKHEGNGKVRWYVSNLFWAQALADHYEAEVVIGLDDSDEEKGESYNAAFHLLPHKTTINRYEKRVLLPLAEYLPFSFLKPLVARYGITDFFTHGKESKVFEGAYPLNISICYEECFSHLIRQGKLGGAKLFINVTNDAWYPSSRLHLSHFSHGKLRAIENGVPLVRACNTGVTAAVDSLGRTVGQLGTENLEVQRGALITELHLYTYPTLYTYFGDYLIVALSFILILWAYIDHRKST